MKILIISLFLSTASCFAQKPYLNPLWEEDQHFCHYRTLCIQASIYRLHEMIHEARKNPQHIEYLLDLMEMEVKNCKNAIGN